MQWFLQGSLIGDNVAEVESSWPIAILCEHIFIIVLFTEPAANDLTFFNWIVDIPPNPMSGKKQPTSNVFYAGSVS